MTLLPSGLDDQVGLPPVVEQLLLDVVADGFTVYCCGPLALPTALAASYEWEDSSITSPSDAGTGSPR